MDQLAEAIATALPKHEWAAAWLASQGKWKPGGMGIKRYTRWARQKAAKKDAERVQRIKTGKQIQHGDVTIVDPMSGETKKIIKVAAKDEIEELYLINIDDLEIAANNIPREDKFFLKEIFARAGKKIQQKMEAILMGEDIGQSGKTLAKIGRLIDPARSKKRRTNKTKMNERQMLLFVA